MDIDKVTTDIISVDTAKLGEKTPFIRAKDAQAELSRLKEAPSKSHGDEMLRRVLASLAKGRADDQKAVSAVARELVELGLYGR